MTKIYAVAAIALLASTPFLGQEFRGTFSGQVHDAQGAAIAKAKVTATQKGTGVKAETLSSETGDYTIPFLTPGVYEIDAGVSGFKTYKREGLTLSIGEHRVVDITLGCHSSCGLAPGQVPDLPWTGFRPGRCRSRWKPARCSRRAGSA